MVKRPPSLRLKIGRRTQSLGSLRAFYLTLFRINQACVHAGSRAELFADTCEILSACGCFDLAWIACPSPGGGRLEVAAANGPLREYAQGLEVSLKAASPLAQGPVGVAFREERTVVCRDWREEACTAPWRARASAYGIRCVAAVPVFHRGRMAVVLALYSRQMHFFHPERMALLETLAQDLSFVLEKFSREEERQASEAYLRGLEQKHLEEITRLNEGLERRVQERTLEMEAANRELTTFAYSISHDLRAPLRHIEGFAGMLATHLGARLDPKGGHYLDVIQGATRRMSHLIEDILAYSRLGRSTVRRTPLDLNGIVQGLIEQLQAGAGGRTVRWVVGALPPLEGDAVLITLLLQNLLDNALKFTRPREEAVIEILPLEAPEGEVGFQVKDNGVGFDQACEGRLFPLFQRLHREEDFEGTGVGLANAQRIATRHGGSIRAEGVVGLGATFFVTLPRTNRTS